MGLFLLKFRGATGGIRRRDGSRAGFTLIELSIVLVIIGLIVGGILVGRDLISAAQVRAQITQIEKFQTAKNTFLAKYGYLPGDITPTAVAQFGFTVVPARAGTGGQGDGNGLIEGYAYDTVEVCDWCVAEGETGWFWEDISSNSNLIPGNFNYGTTLGFPQPLYNTGAPFIGSVLPVSTMGIPIYVYVYPNNGVNYFGLSSIYTLNQNGDPGYPTDNGSPPGITVAQAYAIDRKVDDGMPQAGRVLAQWMDWSIVQNGPAWATAGGVAGANPGAAATGTSSTCYDNGGVASAPMQYSIEQKSGAGNNCALSFQFQ